MEELRAILVAHAKRYPLMQPTDAVKLIYQNEFGGGHLVRDEQRCLQYLRQEYDSLEKNPSAAFFERIGNGIVRVNLAALEERDLTWLGEAFLRSSAEHKGDPARFLQKLKLLRQLAAEKVFSFDADTLEGYLDAYTKAGYPMVSHSQVYRDAYAPAYRVIREIYLDKA